jgi:hypothetical protein
MYEFCRWVIVIAAAAIGYSVAVATADPVTVFQDGFQTDTAGTTTSGEDLDPIIDVDGGDIGGSWVIRESTSAHLRVINDTVPGNDMGGTDNYVEMIRGGSSSSIAKLYATGWDTSLSVNTMVQLDFSLWRQPAALTTIMFANQAPPGSVGGFPGFGPNGPNTATVFHGFGAGGDTEVTAEQWTDVQIVADMLAQSYTVSIDGGAPTNHAFWDPDDVGPEVNEVHQVQTIMFFTGANDAVHYIDNVQFQVLNPPTPDGDYNGDGFVDAADYVLWRKDPASYGGDPDGYNAWRANFGQMSPGSGTSLTSLSVPEPSVILVWMAAVSAWCGTRISGWRPRRLSG